jgi:hypothetical protein
MTIPSIMAGYFNSIKGKTFNAIRASYAPDREFRVPQGVTTIHAVAIGGGGGGGASYVSGSNNYCKSAGGGGALSCTDRYSDIGIPVIPGEILSVRAGLGGDGGQAGESGILGNGTDGGDSYIKRGSTYLLLAKGGTGGNKTNPSSGNQPGGDAASGIGSIRFSGGYGGAASLTNNGTSPGGGGAAGYGGNGGNGVGTGLPISGVSTHGSGAGGATAAGGGGVGCIALESQIISGNVACEGGTFSFAEQYITGGTDGTLIRVNVSPPSRFAGGGGRFGGGGGAGKASGTLQCTGGFGGGGVVRIIWGPGRRIPDILVNEFYYGDGYDE